MSSSNKEFSVVDEQRVDGDVPQGETIGSSPLDMVWDIVHDKTLKNADRLLLLRYYLLLEGGLSQTNMTQNKDALGWAYNTAKDAHSRLRKAGLLGGWAKAGWKFRVNLPEPTERVMVRRVSKCHNCAEMEADANMLKQTLHLLVKQGKTLEQDGSKSADQILLEFLEQIGFTGDDELKETHKRVTEFLKSFQPKEKGPTLSLVPTSSTDPIIVTGLKFHSLCAHHLLPFFGEATIAILPDGAIPGLGDFPRTLNHFSNQPQIQERLSGQIADHLHSQLGAQAVVVSLKAKQLCMEMRGSKASGEIYTVASRGSRESIARLEVLIGNSKNMDLRDVSHMGM